MTLTSTTDTWNAADFTDLEFQVRHRSLRSAMTERGLDLCVLIDPRSIQYLTGYRGKSYQEFQCVFFGLDKGPLTVITRTAEVHEFEQCELVGTVHGYSGIEPGDPIALLADVVRNLAVAGSRIGCEFPDGYLTHRDARHVRQVFEGNPLTDISNLVFRLKRIKSPAELAMMRRATEFLDAGMRSALAYAEPGRTEHELAGAIYRTVLAAGSDVAPSPINIGSGERTALAHPLPTERRLRAGDPMHLEFGASYRRYTVTIGRNVSFGTPTPMVREIHDCTLAACDALIAAVRPGVSSAVPHAAARRVMVDAGWDYARLHCSGYELGTAYPPSFFGGSTFFFDGYPYEPDVLEEGMVISVEPPIFAADKQVGARIIDNILVTATGAEILSSTPRDLFIID